VNAPTSGTIVVRARGDAAALVKPLRRLVAAAEPERTVSSVPQQALVEPEVVVLTPPDPNRPKRAGWWSKAKAALTGE